MFAFVCLQEIYQDRKKFSKAVFEVASSDLVHMGITVVSYTLKDIRDEEVPLSNMMIILSIISIYLGGTLFLCLFGICRHFLCLKDI